MATKVTPRRPQKPPAISRAKDLTKSMAALSAMPKPAVSALGAGLSKIKPKGARK
jgi:hypothetical protein